MLRHRFKTGLGQSMLRIKYMVYPHITKINVLVVNSRRQNGNVQLLSVTKETECRLPLLLRMNQKSIELVTCEDGVTLCVEHKLQKRKELTQLGRGKIDVSFVLLVRSFNEEYYFLYWTFQCPCC